MVVELPQSLFQIVWTHSDIEIVVDNPKRCAHSETEFAQQMLLKQRRKLSRPTEGRGTSHKAGWSSALLGKSLEATLPAQCLPRRLCSGSSLSNYGIPRKHPSQWQTSHAVGLRRWISDPKLLQAAAAEKVKILSRNLSQNQPRAQTSASSALPIRKPIRQLSHSDMSEKLPTSTPDLDEGKELQDDTDGPSSAGRFSRSQSSLPLRKPMRQLSLKNISEESVCVHELEDVTVTVDDDSSSAGMSLSSNASPLPARKPIRQLSLRTIPSNDKDKKQLTNGCDESVSQSDNALSSSSGESSALTQRRPVCGLSEKWVGGGSLERTSSHLPLNKPMRQLSLKDVFVECEANNAASCPDIDF